MFNRELNGKREQKKKKLSKRDVAATLTRQSPRGNKRHHVNSLVRIFAHGAFTETRLTKLLLAASSPWVVTTDDTAREQFPAETYIPIKLPQPHMYCRLGRAPSVGSTGPMSWLYCRSLEKEEGERNNSLRGRSETVAGESTSQRLLERREPPRGEHKCGEQLQVQCPSSAAHLRMRAAAVKSCSAKT